jgi:hypothetical protein
MRFLLVCFDSQGLKRLNVPVCKSQHGRIFAEEARLPVLRLDMRGGHSRTEGARVFFLRNHREPAVAGALASNETFGIEESAMPHV